MSRIKAIGMVIFLIFMEMAIFTFITSFSKGLSITDQIFTVETLIGNILFIILYNPIYLFFTYKRRNSTERAKENYNKLKEIKDAIF